MTMIHNFGALLSTTQQMFYEASILLQRVSENESNILSPESTAHSKMSSYRSFQRVRWEYLIPDEKT